jgi:hypothetical protein
MQGHSQTYLPGFGCTPYSFWQYISVVCRLSCDARLGLPWEVRHVSMPMRMPRVMATGRTKRPTLRRERRPIAEDEGCAGRRRTSGLLDSCAHDCRSGSMRLYGKISLGRVSVSGWQGREIRPSIVNGAWRVVPGVLPASRRRWAPATHGSRGRSCRAARHWPRPAPGMLPSRPASLLCQWWAEFPTHNTPA